MLYTNFIWDFDGMLFNTYPRMCAAFCEAMRQMGHPRPEAEILAAIKQSVRGAASDYSKRLGIDRQTLLDLYHSLEHAQPLSSIVPYDGAESFLRAVLARGGRHFLYTHRDYVALDALHLHHLDDCFTGAITADDPFPLKPAPDALLHLMAQYEIDPSTAVMLGDRDIDVEAAHNAGIAGCLVDPDHFYDHYETSLRAGSITALYELMKL